MPPGRPKRRDIDPEVIAFIEAVEGLNGWTPTRIHVELKRLHRLVRETHTAIGAVLAASPQAPALRPWLERPERKLPSLRTVQRAVRDLRVSDESRQWSLGDPATTVDEAAAVPRIWAAVASRRRDRTEGLTRDEAELATRIAAVLPELHPWDVWRLVVAYQRRKTRGIDTADLDFLVGSAPGWMRLRAWREIEAARLAQHRRHRELWPDRPWVFLPASAELDDALGDGLDQDDFPDEVWPKLLSYPELSGGMTAEYLFGKIARKYTDATLPPEMREGLKRAAGLSQPEGGASSEKENA